MKRPHVKSDRQLVTRKNSTRVHSIKSRGAQLFALSGSNQTQTEKEEPTNREEECNTTKIDAPPKSNESSEAAARIDGRKNPTSGPKTSERLGAPRASGGSTLAQSGAANNPAQRQDELAVHRHRQYATQGASGCAALENAARPIPLRILARVDQRRAVDVGRPKIYFQ